MPRRRIGWWAVVAAAFALTSLAARLWDPRALDWQPALALAQPWRAWTAAWVHYSLLHLAANVAGAVLVGALGEAAAVPTRSAVAWLAAWPLTQLGLLVQPELRHFGGLSGVLHAGVAVIAVHLLCDGSSRQRRIALALLLGLGLKLLSDTPWQGALQHRAHWDITIAPMAHVTGALAGALCALAAETWHRARRAL